MKKKICLNMIVKNEEKVIERCINSIKHLIDYWVIVDTGSTDQTKEKIKKCLKGIPGELHERPWVNFGANRTEMMKLAEGKSDYLLFVDADDRILFDPGFKLPKLEHDLYSIVQREGIDNVFREHHVFFLVRNNGNYSWEGVIHEYLVGKKPGSRALLSGVLNEYINDGDRSKDPNKCKKDIQVLEKAFADNPNDSRSVFYLARTFYSIRDHIPAIKYFQKRSEMGGDPLEVYQSLLYIAISQKKLGYDPEVFIKSFEKAHLYRPIRAEAIYEIARYYAENKNYLLAYSVIKVAQEIPLPPDNLFVESWVYDWGVPLYSFICSRQVGRVGEAMKALDNLLANPRLPPNIKTEFKLEEWKTQLEQQAYCV